MFNNVLICYSIYEIVYHHLIDWQIEINLADENGYENIYSFVPANVSSVAAAYVQGYECGEEKVICIYG